MSSARLPLHSPRNHPAPPSLTFPCSSWSRSQLSPEPPQAGGCSSRSLCSPGKPPRHGGSSLNPRTLQCLSRSGDCSTGLSTADVRKIQAQTFCRVTIFNSYFTQQQAKALSTFPAQRFTLTDEQLCLHLFWEATLRLLAAELSAFLNCCFLRFRTTRLSVPWAVDLAGWSTDAPPSCCDFITHLFLASGRWTGLRNTSPNKEGTTNNNNSSSSRKKGSCNPSGRRSGHRGWELLMGGRCCNWQESRVSLKIFFRCVCKGTREYSTRHHLCAHLPRWLHHQHKGDNAFWKPRQHPHKQATARRPGGSGWKKETRIS